MTGMPLVKEIRLCQKCGRPFPAGGFPKNQLNKNGRRYSSSDCKECRATYMKTYLKRRLSSNPKVRMHLSSYVNARAKGVEHSIGLKDIPLPTTCKYLGVELDYRSVSDGKKSRVWNGASIDRIDPAKGYTPDNIQVISDLANRMKQDATPSQLLKFAFGVIGVHGLHKPF